MLTSVILKKILRVFAVIGFAFFQNLSGADSLAPFTIVDSKPVSEFWINPGFYSYHFQTEKNLDNNNIGLGVEYRYSTVSAITAGRFHNSDRQISSYAAWYWQPLALGSARIGALFGVIDGYPKAGNGAWFPMALPVISFEYNNIGISFTLIPTYKDIVYGSLTVQLRLKVF